jgi:hypothetical protein
MDIASPKCKQNKSIASSLDLFTGPGFSLKLDREVENHSEGTKFPLMWLKE